MAAKKVLVAYQTKGGVAGEYAAIVADVLRASGLEVDVVDLKEQGRPDIAPYGAVVIGSGIRLGRWYGRAKRMLRRDYGERPVAIFLASGGAGDPKTYDESREKYLTRVLAKRPHLKVVAAEAFGGRYVMRGTVVDDHRQPDRVRAWAGELAGKLKG